jgi:hypothetical protein
MLSSLSHILCLRYIFIINHDKNTSNKPKEVSQQSQGVQATPQDTVSAEQSGGTVDNTMGGAVISGIPDVIEDIGESSQSVSAGGQSQSMSMEVMQNMLLEIYEYMQELQQNKDVGTIKGKVNENEQIVVSGTPLVILDNDEGSVISAGSSKAMIHENNLVKSSYDGIPNYNGDGDVQKLFDFILKVEMYFRMAEISPAIQLNAVIMKLTGSASLL